MRRTQEVTITQPGRDQGKVFLLTEMPAEEGELWATLAMDLLQKSGFLVLETVKGGAEPKASAEAQDEPGEEAKVSGMAGLALKVQPFTFETGRALQDQALDNMWRYVQYQPKAKGHAAKPPPQQLFEGDACQIEEWTTRLRLRVEFVQLHTGFFSNARRSTSQDSPVASRS